MNELSAFHTLIDRGYNRGDLSVIDEVCASTFLDHQYPAPPETGPTVLRNDIRVLRQMFSDLKLVVKDAVLVKDKVWSHIECTAVDNASGKSVQFEVMDITRFENGKMVEHWGIPDRFALLHQTGKIASNS